MPGLEESPKQSTKPTYPWYLRGVVVHGHGRGGSQLGYPTANVKLDGPTIDALGTYNNLVLYGYGCIEPETPGSADGAIAGVNGKADTSAQNLGPFPFVMSVGYNPQFKDVALSAEVHFLQTFPEDFYGHVVRIVVVGSIREMYAFKSLQELIDTINNDVVKAEEHMKDGAVNIYAQDDFVQPDAKLPENVRTSLPYMRIGQ
uniref:riboflavin kinase n=1 Tax=Herpetomonas muscarum TaxID=5718 RepID=T1YS62_HERMU|nr:riboflavin kinase [Herpetomonas muscarum]